MEFSKQVQLEKNYFDIPAVSASGIKTFLKQSPYHYWLQSPFNPEKVTFEPTDAMIFGRVVHKLLLEPETFFNDFVIRAKTIDLRTNKGKAEYELLVASNPTKEIVKEDDFLKAKEMIEILKNNPDVNKLLSKGFAEAPLTWNKYGIDCKAKMDYSQDGLIIDYKTQADITDEGVARAALDNNGYHRQAALYLEGYAEVFGKPADNFILIFQEKEKPYSFRIEQINPESLAVGIEENRLARAGIKHYLDKGFFPSYNHEKKIGTISLSDWYRLKGTEYAEFLQD